MAEERSLTERRGRRPWWMTTGAPAPRGDVWFDRLWPEWPRWYAEEFTPALDIYEEEGTYHLKAELPGISKDDISIDVDGNLVTVSGKKESEREEEGKSYYVRESSYGSFSRSFQLPYDVDEDKVDATLKDGVLDVVMPPKESAKRKKIEVKG
jgi:HSP20 family protein